MSKPIENPLWNQLYLFNAADLNLPGNEFLPWIWPIVSLSTWYFSGRGYGLYAPAVGFGVAMLAETANLWMSFKKEYGPEWASSLPEILLCAVPGTLAATASLYLFGPGAWSSLLAGFVGYEAFIQTAERQSQGSNPRVLAKAPFWMFSLTSLAILYFL